MNKCEMIFQQLKHDIIHGVYPPGSKFPSEYDLALRFEVNVKTANKAVTLLAAAGLLERGSRGQGTRVRTRSGMENNKIMVFLGAVTHEYYCQVLQGVQERAWREQCLTVYLSPRGEELPDLLEKLENLPIVGIITHGYGRIQCRNHPVIYIDMLHADNTVHNITGNNFQAGRDAVKLLYERGHRQIAGFFCEQIMPGRMRGTVDALNELQISEDDRFIFNSPGFGSYDARNFVDAIQKKQRDFTAVVCGSDSILLQLVSILKEEKPHLAEKLALIGFGNMHEVAQLPNCATFDQHPRRIGILAAEKMLALQNVPENAPRIYEEVPMELVRSSNIPDLRQR